MKTRRRGEAYGLDWIAARRELYEGPTGGGDEERNERNTDHKREEI